MIRSGSICLLLIGWAWGASYQSAWWELEWNQFKDKFEKSYQNDLEDQYRQKVFSQNLRKIAEHNLLYQKGIYSYEMGVNRFADLTEEEFFTLYTFPLNSTSKYDDLLLEELEEDEVTLPALVDWSKKGAVTEVKDQGKSCGSCWSFAATGVLEGQWFLKTHQLVSLSEQNLIDCTDEYGNRGCRGGFAYKALSYIHDVGGIYSEAEYPYRAEEDLCQYTQPGNAAKVKKVVRWKGDEVMLQKKVATVGPISVSIVVEADFSRYKQGIYNNPYCGDVPNHEILVVGYGTENGHEYWLAKNSWGKDWGDNGYIKMARNKRNQCGIGLGCTYPIV